MGGRRDAFCLSDDGFVYRKSFSEEIYYDVVYFVGVFCGFWEGVVYLYEGYKKIGLLSLETLDKVSTLTVYLSFFLSSMSMQNYAQFDSRVAEKTASSQ